LFGRQAARPVKKRVLGKKLDSFLDLSPGDLVIHVSYGLARFLGLETIKKTQVEEEHLKLEFADHVVVFVPVSRIQLIQKYVGAGKSAPKLAKISSTAWAKQKKTVQEAVLNLAMEMIDLQAQRSALGGTPFPPDSDWQMEFEGLFPWQETSDQLSAIADIKQDMEHSKPMDRLLCGDVGFGKTEVALRAAFKAVDAGFQVAILVPTTVLAEQHYRVFKERLLTFPVSVDVLSRFTPNNRRRLIRESLQDGTLDIVVGTNALTRSDIAFHNLGLIIIDEEQKFGVQDKEKLKQLRHLTDVLTMTATPIPRTLHFSLLGLRDISNLETPPANRLPVETRVMRFDSDFVRRAILRELNRQGQVYFVHNRVFDIEEVVWKLKQIVPEARIGVGHAQMSDDQLESVMRDFILQKYDVLVCTTIIESGLDIPNANTIFIDRADRFGLAELHQLRGRVGRDRFQAYCYLLLEPNQVLNPDATRRLKAIEEYSHLGSGFNIAMRDLEIRGAGNILGTQQSGHIAMVGYEMYCNFLEDAVRALKKMPQKTVIDVEVDLPGTALIPRSYIGDQHTKIDVYRRLLRISSLEEYYLIQQELQDRFGPEPPEVRRLLLHARIRVDAFRYRIYSLQLTSETGQWFVTMKFHGENYVHQLRDDLKCKGLELRVTDDLKGHVPIPNKFFDSAGNVKEKELTDFIVDFLRLKPQ
ncbi:MAG: transcription-repair coupling factor, partial [Thermoguttaceae bacterium]|nr:transcription-repair coupling factor [Thermoguttaceae bacterium]